MSHKKIVCFGEVLWDILPSEAIAGGAPMNVAIRLQALGVPTKIISRIGKDQLGQDLLAIIKAKQVETSLIQEDEQLPTGQVLVKLDDKGSATYDIVQPSAWDAIALSDTNKAAVSEADVFVFGSLACRNAVSKATLFSLLEVAKYKVFDVNLRAPFYSIELIDTLMQKANFIKLNDEELLEIAQALGSGSQDLIQNIRFIAQRTGAYNICVTRGKDGAVLFMDAVIYEHPGYQVQVADTIGAGDSFLAALISRLLSSTEHQESLAFACAVGAAVAARKGANPVLSESDIVAFGK